MTQKLIRLRSWAPKVIQNRAYVQSHAVIQELHPLKPKPSLHTASLWLSQHKPVLGFQGVASRAFSYFVATWWKLSLSISSPQTLEGTSNYRGTPWKDPVQNTVAGTAAMLYGHAANSFHHWQYLSSTQKGYRSKVTRKTTTSFRKTLSWALSIFCLLGF